MKSNIVMVAVQQAESPSSAVRKLRLSSGSNGTASERSDLPDWSQAASSGREAAVPGPSSSAGSALAPAAEGAAASAVPGSSIGVCCNVAMPAGSEHTSQQPAPPSEPIGAQGQDGCSPPRSSGAGGQPHTPVRSGTGQRGSGGARTPAKRHISDIPTTR